MDAEERALFSNAVNQAAQQHSAAALDAALVEIGWADAFASDPQTAVAVLFEAQGRTLARSSALDLVAGTTTRLVFGAGMDPDFGVVAAGPKTSAVGRLAVAHELIGASRAMLELARTHALEREQFGRPIAAFQAVRHRLAEAFVAIESAEASVAAAWLDGTDLSAMMAKAIAGKSAKTVAKHCQQVLAGIGFTAEHPLHRYVRRTLVLDDLLGDHVTLTRTLGAEILRTRALPPKLPL